MYLPRIEQKWAAKQKKLAENTSIELQPPSRDTKDDPKSLAQGESYHRNLAPLTAIPEETTNLPTSRPSSTPPPPPLAATTSQPLHPQHRFLALMRTNLQRPLRMLLTQPVVQLLALYMAMLYGTLFLFLFAYPRLWTSPRRPYHQSTTIVSLSVSSQQI